MTTVRDVTTVKSGLERKLDGLGRIVIPTEIRRRFDLHSGDLLDVSVTGNAIVLTPVAPCCETCGRPNANA